MKMTLASKLWVGLGIFILTLIVTDLIINRNVSTMEKNLREVTTVEGPIRAAAYEMEVHVSGTGIGVLKYLDASDPQYREQVKKHEAEFEKFRAQYDRLAETPKRRESGKRVGLLYQEYERLGESLLNEKDKQEALFAKMSESFEKIYEIINRRIRGKISLEGAGGPEKVERLANMESDMAKFGTWLGSYLRTPRKPYEERMYGAASSFRRDLNRFKTLNLTPAEAYWASELGKTFNQIMSMVQEALALKESSRESVKKFLDLRKEIDGVMSEEIQMSIGKDLTVGKEEAYQTIREARRTILLILVIGLVVGSGAAVIIGLGIIRPIRKLEERAHDENLERRIIERTERLEAANKELQNQIAERQRAEEARAQLLAYEQASRAEAEAANRAKDEFLALISHELRKPLTSLLGWTKLLRAGNLGEVVTARALTTIERNVKSHAQIIEDILDVSQIIRGKLSLDVRPVELVPIIEAAIDAVRSAAHAKGVRIKPVLDPGTGLVSGDPDRLQQVVRNLLSNAVEFTPKGGRVQVRLERVDSQARITVSDTGVGISPEFLPHVFDRPVQVDSTSIRKRSGLGLGLAVVRHLVELHGGTIHAESPGEGQGTTFTVRLPLAQLRIADFGLRNEKVADEKSAIRNPQSAILNGLRVLVVDDEADARDLLTIMLEQYGAKVIAVASAGEALEALKRLRPDVLVSDIGLSGEDGYALIRKVRTLEPERGGRIPAVALTAYAKMGDRLRALEAGYQMYVSKPLEPAELAAVVANVAGRVAREAGA